MALVFIVEDDNDIRQIEAYALKCGGFEIEEFEDAKALYERLEKKTPDLFLLDVMLPDEDGLEIVKKLRAMPQTKHLPVMMVTAKTTELDKVRGLDIGADDYMTKPFGIMELLSRVKALLRRSAGAQTKRLEVGNLVLDDERHLVMVKGENCELTFKEYELLKLLMANCGMVLTREVIMERVWGTDFEGESRTLDMHIKTLRQKLGEEGSMIRTVRNVGYLLENAVYIELRRFGFQVYVGTIRDKEVDFVAMKDDRIIYIQVAYMMETEETMEREYASLLSIADSYEKYVVSMDEVQFPSREGIRHVQAWNLSEILK